MRGMKRGLTILGFIIVLALGGCWWVYPSASLRYEITVEVEADGQVYSGSSVHEVTLRRQPQLLSAPPVSGDFKGEAVAVNIADRGTLFVLLTGSRCCQHEPFSEEHGYGPDARGFVREVFDVRASSAQAIRSLPFRQIDADVPFNQLPMMVRFDDISDPLTVALVNPNDLAASFGEGVELRRVHVQTTRARVTSGIDERLPWLASRKRGYLDGARLQSSRELTNTLHYGHFRTGFW
jgi:hypothetical protein